MIKYINLLFFFLSGCVHEAPRRPNAVPPIPTEEEAQESALARFFNEFVGEHSYVTSYYIGGERKGERERLGDASLWTWVAIGALSCDDAEGMVSDQLQLIVDKGGRIDRHDRLRVPGDSSTWYSFDQESGFLHGLARHLARCGADPLVDVAWDTREAYITANGGRLHEDPAVGELPPEFTVLRDTIAWKLGKGEHPKKRRISALTVQLAAWLKWIKSTKADCYRAHLAWLYVSALEAVDRPLPDEARDALCVAADGLSIPVWEHYCGRDDLSAFIANFRYNAYEYSFQRCPWESPDGSPDLATPALDLIVAYGLKHGV